MLKLAFEVPVPHLPDFEDLQDFHVARAEVAMADPKYREKVKPIGLLIAPPTPIPELRRIVTLCTPHHVTVWPGTRSPDEVRAFLDQCNVAFDTELAVVVSPEAPGVFAVAVAEDVSVIYIPQPTAVPLLPGYSGPWLHFEEIADPEALRALLALVPPAASLHTAKPVKLAFYGCDDWRAVDAFPAVEPGQHLTETQVARARSLMAAMREVCR